MGPNREARPPAGRLKRLVTGATAAQCRDTGLAAVLILLLVVYFGDRPDLVLPAIILLVLAMAWPPAFRPLAGLWFGLSHVLGTVVSKVILSALFFALVTPIGLLRRLLGADPLQLKRWKQGRESVFMVRSEPIAPQDLERPY
ncbi:MAG: hypothetical protein FJ128_09160 [Deltaproteobacteria bacterium]|nr:hypothetical protein [Deltaproteobacteria bacterium]